MVWYNVKRMESHDWRKYMKTIVKRIICILLLFSAVLAAGGCATAQQGPGRWDQQRLPEDQRPPAWEYVVSKSM